jgi:NADH-quinone oxidoreductase subunit L
LEVIYWYYSSVGKELDFVLIFLSDFGIKNQEFNDAAKKAFIMNRIGDLIWDIHHWFLFSTLLLFKTAIAGTDLNMYWISIAAFALSIGACGKSAQIPLYTWLPDAMAGPTVFGINTPMVTAGIFMITRLNLFDSDVRINTLL